MSSCRDLEQKNTGDKHQPESPYPAHDSSALFRDKALARWASLYTLCQLVTLMMNTDNWPSVNQFIFT